jgi:predicted transcriptional regulator
MVERPALSRGEMEVARILWELGSASVRQVHEHFPAGRQMDFTTVQTYLRRLEEKGYVQATLLGRTRIYRPRVKAKTVIRDTLNDLIERLFGGEAFPLIRHVVEDRKMAPSDIAALRDLIKRLDADSTDEPGEP